MGTGTKILAGCGCLAILAGIAAAVALSLGLFWLKDEASDMASHLEEVTARTNEIEEWEEKANAHPYDRPADGVIPEERLTTFLDVRRHVHEVYSTYKAELEQLRERAEGDAGALTPTEVLGLGGRAVQMFGDLRLAQVKALAESGMSEQEYYAIQTAVYVAAGVSRTEAETGTAPADAMSKAAEQIQEVMRAALETAQKQSLPGADRVSESDLKGLEQGLEKMGARGAEALTVPPENLELFRKHQAEIDKYAMHGLTLLGL
ncbi:MAG: hypothetical protein LJF30_06415 [Acidobacteria bacterium]|nr:hypothetical protein [Acidobacteriota bacterium]